MPRNHPNRISLGSDFTMIVNGANDVAAIFRRASNAPVIVSEPSNVAMVVRRASDVHSVLFEIEAALENLTI